jgi:hypothetical protein
MSGFLPDIHSLPFASSLRRGRFSSLSLRNRLSPQRRSLPSPALREDGHGRFARQLVAVGRSSDALGAVPARPHPLPVCRPGRRYEQDASNDDAVFEHAARFTAGAFLSGASLMAIASLCFASCLSKITWRYFSKARRLLSKACSINSAAAVEWRVSFVRSITLRWRAIRCLSSETC